VSYVPLLPLGLLLVTGLYLFALPYATDGAERVNLYRAGSKSSIGLPSGSSI